MKKQKSVVFGLFSIALIFSVGLNAFGQEEKVPPTKEETVNWINKRLADVVGQPYKQSFTADGTSPEAWLGNEEKTDIFGGYSRKSRGYTQYKLKYSDRVGKISGSSISVREGLISYRTKGKFDDDGYCGSYSDEINSEVRTKDIDNIEPGVNWYSVETGKHVKVLLLRLKSLAKYDRNFYGYSEAEETTAGLRAWRCKNWSARWINTNKEVQTIGIFYIHDSDEDFEKLKKAFFHLRDLVKAEDDLF